LAKSASGSRAWQLTLSTLARLNAFNVMVAISSDWSCRVVGATSNPFDKKYSKVEDAVWESSLSVLNLISVRELMETGWA
jgi:hypothetical protein